MPTTVSALLSPVSEQAFFDGYFEVAPLFLPRQQASGHQHILAAADLEEVVSMACRQPEGVEVLTAGATNKPPRLTRESDPPAALAAYQSGSTLRARNVERFWPSVSQGCRELAAGFECPLTANLYLTPPNAQGLQRHFDFLDVFILQVAGAKRWTVYSPDRELPNLHTPSAGFASEHHNWEWPRLRTVPNVDVVMTPEMRAGDILYLPRGFGHEAACLREPSAHLTLALLTFTWTHVAEVALAAAAATDPVFRRSIRRGSDAETREALRRFAETADLGDARTRMLKAWARTCRDLPGGGLRSCEPAAEIAPDTQLKRSAGLTPTIIVGENILTLAWGDTSLRFRRDQEEAVRYALTSDRFSAAELPVPSAEEGLEIARQLVRSGVVRRTE